MQQLSLFNVEVPLKPLETNIERCEDKLLIPEGLHTIPCTHGIHRFAGKFIPNIPRYVLRNIISNQNKRTILDPFCGSGTTLVEAALEGQKFIGLDIDPLSVAISTVKTQPLSEVEIQELEIFWQRCNFKQPNLDLVPSIPNLQHWFSEQTIIELSALKTRCLELPQRLQLFSLIVFSSIIRRVSNADDQTQKTYVSHTLPKTPPLPSILFPVFLSRAIDGMREYIKLLPSQPNGLIQLGDATSDIHDYEFDDIITSPPYIDSIDYIYNHMLEYFWLLNELGVHTYQNLQALRKRPMGFRLNELTLNHNSMKHFLNSHTEMFDQICFQIKEKSPKEELAVRSFFMDYARHVENAYSRQKKGGYYICIVGNSLIRGITIPTADLIISIHTSLGYELTEQMTYEIRRHYMKFPRRNNSGKINEDHVLIFKAHL